MSYSVEGETGLTAMQYLFERSRLRVSNSASQPLDNLDKLAMSQAAEEDRSKYWDKEGKPISDSEWEDLGMKTGYDLIAETELPNGVYVLTEWRGYMPIQSKEPHQIFDSVAVVGDGEIVLDEVSYNTEAEAIEGHAAMVEIWRRRSG